MQKQSLKRHSRKPYLNDFHKSDSGAYAYKGALYSYIPKNKSLKQALVQLWALYGSLLLVAIAAGCLPNTGIQNTAYIILPYTILLIASIRLCWAMGRLTAGGNPLREYIYQASVLKLPIWSIVVAILAILSILGEIIFLFLHEMQSSLIPHFLLIALLLYVCIIAFWARHIIRQLQWSK